jgi:hypothetical protein
LLNLPFMIRGRSCFYIIVRLAVLELTNDHSLIEVVTLKFCATNTSYTVLEGTSACCIHIVMAIHYGPTLCIGIHTFYVGWGI